MTNAPESIHPLWPGPVPEKVIVFLTYTALAKYAAEKLNQRVVWGRSSLEHMVEQDQEQIVRSGQAQPVLAALQLARAAQEGISSFCTQLISEAEQVQNTFGVKSTYNEYKPHWVEAVIDTPRGKFKAKARITKTKTAEGEIDRNPAEVVALWKDLEKLLDGLTLTEPIAVRYTAALIGEHALPLQNGRFYIKPYNI